MRRFKKKKRNSEKIARSPREGSHVMLHFTTRLIGLHTAHNPSRGGARFFFPLFVRVLLHLAYGKTQLQQKMSAPQSQSPETSGLDLSGDASSDRQFRPYRPRLRTVTRSGCRLIRRYCTNVMD
jgi:hypothetical protein